MNINNLVFFDKNGESYNFSQNENEVWEGSDYFLPISTALYDVSNLFILEKTQTGYKFPVLAPGSRLRFKWKTAESADSFFLFTIEREDPNLSESNAFIARQTQLEVNYYDIQPGGTSPLDLSYPLQINVGFSPIEEIKYDRTLDVYYEDGSTTTLVASIYFYGEGEDEDERFRIWLANFGIKFNREDALILKNYDLKESLPDWKQINQARKEILVNRDQIYPYVGTYKGLLNLINILGYRDVLRVKEYWRDVDPNSAYYNKFAMVDVTDLMTLGSIDQVNLVDLNGQIKKGGKFKKTEFLALAYEFSVASDNFDDDGVPEVEFTTEFEVDEIFYKLNRLATKLKNEILPVNVVIRDIIGEFIYFSKFNLRNWSDMTLINSLEINEDYQVIVNSPNPKAQLFLIRDIKTLYPKTQNSAFPEITFNTSTVDPYSNGQKYPISSLPALLTGIQDYYINLKRYEFQYHGEPNPMMSGDDIDGKVGCPISLESYVPDFSLQELDGVKFQDFVGSQFTIGNIRYRSGYEIEWNITGPQGYVFNWRGTLSDLVKIPHVLPHTGNYTISSTVFDLLGGQSVSYLNLTVLEEEPVMEVFTKLQDKNSYRFSDLQNITVGDIKSSPIFLPFANVIQGGKTNSTLTQHYLDWYTYFNNFGVGNPQTEIEIFTEGVGFEPITTSSNSAKMYWGTGSHLTGQPSLLDYEDATLKDLSLVRMIDISYVPDKINGFILDLPNYPAQIEFINFADWNILNSYVVSSYTDADDLAAQLNAATHPQVSEYRYVPLNGRIHAQAKRQDRALHRILELFDSNGDRWRVYTFCEPFSVYSPQTLQSVNQQLLQERERQIDLDLLFLNAPFEDILYSTGEKVYSTTNMSIPLTPPASVFLDLTKAVEFDSSIRIRVTSILNQNHWFEGYPTQVNPTRIEVSVLSQSGLIPATDSWKITYVSEVSHVPATYAKASHINYWINKGFIEFTDTDSQNVQVRGYLPSNYDENSFTLNSLKIGLDGLSVPLHQPVFSAVSNIESKKEAIWTLSLHGETVVQIKSNSYFIWRFSTPGDYLLKVQVTDVNNNTYTLSKEFNAVDAMKITAYRNYLETTLNRRKALM